jgi:hypothetical protein
MKKYIPQPADVSDIALPEDVEALAETIAKNTHEVWAKARIGEGWTLGPVRDDRKKQTPCLVAYEDLPEFEKQYDRIISENVLKLIVKLGYDIEKTKK